MPVTMDDVAQRAGVSRALVSLVMRNSPRVSAESRTAVLEAAEQLGYRPNLAARNLASARTRTIGVLLSDLHNAFFAEIYDGVELAASANDYQLLLTTGARKPGNERRAIDQLLDMRVDALILAAPRVDAGAIDKAAATVPTVVISRTVRSRRVGTVTCDDRVGAGLAVRHLAELGHRRIAHVDGGGGAGAAARRIGYERAMSDLDLGTNIRIVSGDFTEEGGVAAVSELLRGRHRPTAVFAANDLSAVGVLDAVEDAGLQVPRDLSLVGYDNTALAALHHVSLTTIDQPRCDMGRIAVDMLLRHLDDENEFPLTDHVLEPSLVVRRTTGPRLSAATRSTAASRLLRRQGGSHRG